MNPTLWIGVAFRSVARIKSPIVSSPFAQSFSIIMLMDMMMVSSSLRTSAPAEAEKDVFVKALCLKLRLTLGRIVYRGVYADEESMLVA